MDPLLSNVNRSDNLSQVEGGGRAAVTARSAYRLTVTLTHEKLAASSMLPVPL